MKKIMGITMCFLLLFSLINICSATNLGGTSYGYVEKFTYGNQSSNDTIAIITGVHPQENGFHTAVSNAVSKGSGVETRNYIVYKVHVNQSQDDYNMGRMNGQLLAQQFVVPDVIKMKPKLVFDIHENHYIQSGYAYPRFLYPISKDNLTRNYTKMIVQKMPFLKIYAPPNPTSTKYVTIPISNARIPTVIYETYAYDSMSRKAYDANLFVNTIDKMKL
jgi:hypothetical protein